MILIVQHVSICFVEVYKVVCFVSRKSGIYAIRYHDTVLVQWRSYRFQVFQTLVWYKLRLSFLNYGPVKRHASSLHDCWLEHPAHTNIRVLLHNGRFNLHMYMQPLHSNQMHIIEYHFLTTATWKVWNFMNTTSLFSVWKKKTFWQYHINKEPCMTFYLKWLN